VAVLKLRAVDFDDGPRVAEEDFGGRFNQACLAAAGGAQEEQICHRPAGCGKTRAKDLVNARQSPNGAFLPNHSLVKSRFKLPNFAAIQTGIENF